MNTFILVSLFSISVICGMVACGMFAFMKTLAFFNNMRLFYSLVGMSIVSIIVLFFMETYLGAVALTLLIVFFVFFCMIGIITRNMM